MDSVIIKIIRSIIIFFVIYLVAKYLTTGKIPEKELLMISSSGLITMILLDIYRPIVSINNEETYKNIQNKTCGCYG